MKIINYKNYIDENYFEIEKPILRIVKAEQDQIKLIVKGYKKPLRGQYKKAKKTEKIDKLYTHIMYYGLVLIEEIDEEIMKLAHETKVKIGKKNEKLDKVIWQGILYPYLMLEEEKYCEAVISYLEKYRPLLHELILKKYGVLKDE